MTRLARGLAPDTEISRLIAQAFAASQHGR